MTVLCISGSRADYGYILPIAKALGEEVYDLAPLTVGRDTPDSISLRLGTIATCVAHRIAKEKPRLALVVGDRWEISAACHACVLSGVPIAHYGAGDVTTGSYDDLFRHSISALAALRFGLTEKGSTACNAVWAGCTSVQPPDEIPTGDGTAILALYPETAGDDLRNAQAAICEVLAAHGLTPLVIGSNPDVGASGYPGASLPLAEFHKRLAAASVIIGNSSAGIIEAPILGTPTVNIGARQHGRPQAPSVFQADTGAYSLSAAIGAALAYGKRRTASPYYRPDAVGIVVRAIRSHLRKP